MQFDITPYTVNALSLMVIGLASIFYMLHLKEKSTSGWLMIIGLASFTLSMVCMFLSGVIFWGSVLGPFTDAFSVVSMAAMVAFCYQFPQNATHWASRVIRTLMWGAGALALGISGYIAFKILVLHDLATYVPPVYGYLNPITFLFALGVSIHRTISIQDRRSAGVSGVVKAYLHPQNRPSRLLRNFSLALSIGLIQGYVSGNGLPASAPAIATPVLINLSVLLMLTAMVYAAFDFPAQQPGLVVRLVGLTLVTVQAVLGVIVLQQISLMDNWTVSRSAAVVADTQKALKARYPEAVPEEVLYILRWPLADQAASDEGQIIVQQAGFDARSLLDEAASAAVPPVWSYYLAAPLQKEAAARGYQIQMRYGDEIPGSYYDYIGFVFSLEDARYEVGFSLAELSRAAFLQGMGMIGGVLLSSFILLVIFPLFFQVNLIRPLDRLLSGVRQADAGNLDVNVPVVYNDEVGYLTAAFNKMAASLKRELDGRQAAEAELRQLNLTLEARVSERTRELEALYAVTTASNQAGDSQELLAVLLDRSLSALRTPLGFILLLEEQAEQRKLVLAASQNLPPEWQAYLSDLCLEEEWVAGVLLQTEPILIADTSVDARAPAFMHVAVPLALILAPLCAEGKTLGILGMARMAENVFDLDEVTLLISIANQVAIAVHTEALRQRLRQASVLEERQRLARDLHDSVTQSLYGLVTLTEVGLMRVEAQDLPAAAETYRKIAQSGRQAIREMRLFIHQLRPPVLKEEGLVGALDLRLAAVEGRSDVRARLIADKDLPLSLAVETALYHIAQEALNNALKHAHAAHVTVTLTRQGRCGALLTVEDDGNGFDPQVTRGGMGLCNMQTRAAEIGAQLDVFSRPGAGTRVSVLLERS